MVRINRKIAYAIILGRSFDKFVSMPEFQMTGPQSMTPITIPHVVYRVRLFRVEKV